jgi:hypothetical protein
MNIYQKIEQPGYSDVNYENKYSSKAYKIYVLTEVDDTNEHSKRKPGFNAYSLAYDLGSLKHLEEFGVNLESI